MKKQKEETKEETKTTKSTSNQLGPIWWRTLSRFFRRRHQWDWRTKHGTHNPNIQTNGQKSAICVERQTGNKNKKDLKQPRGNRTKKLRNIRWRSREKRSRRNKADERKDKEDKRMKTEEKNKLKIRKEGSKEDKATTKRSRGSKEEKDN